MVFGLPRVLQPAAFHTSARRGLGLHHHVGDQLLHELEGGERAAELLALLGVGHRRVHAALADAHAARGHAEAARVQRGHRHLEALADLAEQRVVGHLDAVEEQLRGVRGAQAELAVDRGRGEALGVGGHQEGGQPPVPWLGVGLGEDQRDLGVVAHRDPLLLAVDAPAAVDLARRGSSRLAASEPVSGSVSPKQPSASPEHSRGSQRPSAPRCPSARSTSPRARSAPRPPCAREESRAAHLLDDQAVGAVVDPAPAVLLGDDRAEEAHLGHLGHQLEVEALVAVVLPRARGDLVVGELASGLMHQPLLVRELEADHGLGILHDADGGGRRAASWGFEEGDEIAPGRSVLKRARRRQPLRGLLVWDDRLFAIMVAKVIRPDQVATRAPCASWSRRPRRCERLAHPVLVRGFDAVLEGPHPHVLIEHLEGPTLRRLIRKGGPLRAGAAAPARAARRRRPALHAEEELGPPRRQARQHRDGHPAAADRPEHRAHRRARARASRARSAPTPTCRPSSAPPSASRARSGRPPMSGASAPRSTTRSRAGAVPAGGGRAESEERELALPTARARGGVPGRRPRGALRELIESMLALRAGERPTAAELPRSRSSRWWRRCRASSRLAGWGPACADA